MIDEEKDLAADGAPSEEGEEEEIVAPRNKYELIMMAAAEAARLNDEMRSKSDDELKRRGIDIQGKVTLQALRRVREGRVKVVAKPGSLARVEPGMPGQSLAEGLFFTPPPPPTPEEPPAGEEPAAEETE